MSSNRSNAFRNLACLTSLAFWLNAGGSQARDDLTFLAPAIKLEQSHDLQAALEQYNKAVQSHPDSWEAYSGRGGLYAQLGKQKEAMADLNKAISLHPDQGSPYVRRSRLWNEWGHAKEALSDALIASKMAADDPEVLLRLGEAKQQLGDDRGATDAYRKDIQKNPKFVKAYVSLARLLELKNASNKESMALLNQAVTFEPKNFQALFARGSLSHRRGNDKAAAGDLRKAAVYARIQGDAVLADKIAAAADALEVSGKSRTRVDQTTP
jgi:tetratricopeptide (TPR) repeat protein